MMRIFRHLGNFRQHSQYEGGAGPEGSDLDLLRDFLRDGERWAPTHRHRKGGLYRVLGQATLETDRSAATIYDDADGEIWVRPTAEFNDGRFDRMP